ncbi:MAG: CHASE2 domain-containing protein [Candidatus Latescibacteria bacterium]|jgi:adenylate cyclase|nr:CHASE2 domain-containing protein [Candidatus Latescibacterota bacterium]
MERLQKIVFAFFFGIAVVVVVYTASQTLLYRPFLKIQNKIDDSHFMFRYRLKGAGNTDTDDIVIVDIDDRSIESLGPFKLWRRHRFALVIQALNRAGVKIIFFDALLAKGGSSENMDNRFLANTIKRAGNVFVGCYFELDEPSTKQRPLDQVYNEKFSSNWLSPQTFEEMEFLQADRIIVPYHDFVMGTRGMGFTNYLPDRDGILRHLPVFISYNRMLYPSASLQMWLYLKQLVRPEISISPYGLRIDKTFIPTDKHCFMRLNFVDSRPVYRYVSFIDVLNRNMDRDSFKNKIVMIGSSSRQLGDLKKIPGYGSLPGVEIHATALSSLLNEKFLSVLSGNVTFLITILSGVLATIFFSIVPPFRVGLPVAICIPFVFYLIVLYAFIVHSVLANIIIPTFVILFLYIVLTIYRFVEHHEKKIAEKKRKIGVSES